MICSSSSRMKTPRPACSPTCLARAAMPGAWGRCWWPCPRASASSWGRVSAMRSGPIRPRWAVGSPTGFAACMKAACHALPALCACGKTCRPTADRDALRAAAARDARCPGGPAPQCQCLWVARPASASCVHTIGHAVGVVAYPAIVVFNLYQAVDVGLEAWAQIGEFAGELEVVVDLFVEHLARDQQRDARWIRRDQAHGDAAFELVDLHALGPAVRNVRVGVRGLQRGPEVRQVHLGRQPRDVVPGVHLVHMLAQVLQAHALVAPVLLAELGQDAPHRLVLAVFVLELLQTRPPRLPPPPRNTH